MSHNTLRNYLLATALTAAFGTMMVSCGGDDNGVAVSTASSKATDSNTPASSAASALSVQVLSTKPEFVSGGDALIAVTAPTPTAGSNASASANPPAVKVTLNGNDISDIFKPDPRNPGQLLGLVSGLKEGPNTVVATFGGKSSALQLTNYPITGPILSGPHISPFICQTQDFTLPDGSKLGPPTDENCSAPTKVQYVYRSTAGGALKPMPSTDTLPSDVAMTTTTQGVTVPFVVRVETGTMNRGIYQNAVLHDPTKDGDPSPTTPPAGWNRRLIANHGSGCTGGWYIQGAAMGVNPLTGDNLTRLGEGYGIFINTLNHPTNSCNATLAGETTMMGKEHFIETFGVPFYTVSTGGSGGAYTSLQVADAFPGLFDGVLISATFPDALSIAKSGLDDKLLNKYLQLNNDASFSEDQMVAVSGHKNARAWWDLALQSGRTDPVPNRDDPIPPSPNPLLGGYKSAVWNDAVPTDLRYDPTTNPKGARPTVFDIARNIYGINPATGFALRPYDNIGVQYGLAELNKGLISTTQFLDLNEKIGGYDQDGNYTTARTAGDLGAIRRAYQAGLQLGGNGGLTSIPVFDFSGLYDEDEFYHYQWFHFAVRERIAEATGGDTRNHVMWRGAGDINAALGNATEVDAALNQTVSTQSWAAFIRWMEAYKADTSNAPQREKVINRKPADIVDGCFTKSATPQFIAEPQTLSREPDSQCNALWPTWTAPRIEAGGPVSADRLKCQLKPIDTADYKVTFSAAELSRLNAIFPSGVCDYSKPGVNQTAVVPYASFGPSAVNQVFDISKP